MSLVAFSSIFWHCRLLATPWPSHLHVPTFFISSFISSPWLVFGWREMAVINTLDIVFCSPINCDPVRPEVFLPSNVVRAVLDCANLERTYTATQVVEQMHTVHVVYMSTAAEVGQYTHLAYSPCAV
ncbi:hypothetical protein F4823DRAFT_467477 [Ustulina deusta]|nr:hypothetical protein F4823DRAFT_467477 [Ustulina deusta]